MVALTFNSLGYRFLDGLRVLEKSFHAAESALLEDLERAKDEAFGHQQSQEQGAAWVGERDEDGHVLWDQQTLLDYRVDDAWASVVEIRNAFAILIYHHWERSALRWTGSTKGDHKQLVNRTKAKGYSVHSQLESVRLLVNTLKHDSENCAPELFKVRPDYFISGFTGPSLGLSWQEAISLQRGNIDELFSIVRASGPDEKTFPTTPDSPPKA